MNGTARFGISAVIFAVTAMVASCASSGPDQTNATHPVIDGNAAPSLKEMRHVRLGRNVGPVAVSDHAVVFPTGPRSGKWDRVELIGLTGQRRQVVAHSQFSHGFINWVAASAAGWIYYVDQSAKQSDSHPSVRWRVVALDPDTRKSKTLASNGDVADPYVPIVRSHGDWVYWTSAEADKTAREQIWKPGWARPRDLLRHIEMTPGSESVDGNSLVYLGKSAVRARGHTIGGDCWSVPLAGGTPEPLTHTALAMSCTASDGWVIWSQHIGPKDPVPSGDGVLDDPYALWATQRGQAPHQLHRGYFSSATPCASGPVVVWSNYQGQWIIQEITDPAGLAHIPGSNSAFAPVCNGKVVAMTNTTHREVTVDVLHVPMR